MKLNYKLKIQKHLIKMPEHHNEAAQKVFDFIKEIQSKSKGAK